MLRGDPEEEFEATAPRQDTELTLGPAMLLGLLCGLVLLCGLCFGVGYTVGRHNAAPSSVAGTDSAMGQTLTAQGAGSLSKPPAKGTMPVETVPQVQIAETSQDAPADGTTPANPLTSSALPAAANPSANDNKAMVKPALPVVAAAQPIKAPSSAQPSPGAGTMVQIAAVSHSEDADVLMNALRKRGYTVAARHVPGDNLIHVQIGPFASRSDASAMSQKLLNDGYNAVLMP